MLHHLCQRLLFANHAPRHFDDINLQPLLILQQDNWSDGLVRQWDRPDSGAASSWSYAAQWYGMALIVMIIYLVLSVKRERPEEK